MKIWQLNESYFLGKLFLGEKKGSKCFYKCWKANMRMFVSTCTALVVYGGERRLWSLMLDCQLFKNKHIDHITAMVCMLGIGVVKKIDSNHNDQIQNMKWPFEEKVSDRDRTRTCNLQIRSLAPYPLGHTVSYWPLTLPVKPTSASYQTMLQCSSLQLKDDL